LFLGAGLEESNAGFLKPLREWFTGLPGGERTIRIYGCGIASSTPVDILRLKKTNPPRQPKMYYDEYSRPVILITGNPNFDIQMIQGKFTESGQGMKFLKAIAKCTGASVQAPIHMEINFPPYFQYTLGSVWVYPDESYAQLQK